MLFYGHISMYPWQMNVEMLTKMAGDVRIGGRGSVRSIPMGIQQPAALCVLVCEWGGVSGHKRGQMGAVRLLMYFFPFNCFIIHTHTKGVSPQKTILLVGYLYELVFLPVERCGDAVCKMITYRLQSTGLVFELNLRRNV
ncbi:hypothetical protein HanRHA438_Chr13g0605241 [Helianthus annuus]|uniref:Uncharacterized protein n=1 Tax=Helianthus annuus TaxID=4232 RepID=A0A251ST47_HELAN|nr:hypothetical protein HanXRQr2_Chr13g0594501 [Helianthus annuus]KAJ0477360.1 hypothetical protein HanHA300_Chr13g0487631 [Helianthus annuus]KAJ0481812.1 hypothetical protein HanIR_Chr13g0646911 [Helianthus annuus]KAJ0498196.1 hypothetical protein HanHA89_Chr13g0519811 [Helianthus annuus]KAJ0664199.1 hypothetical protein HanLR1_Chr13g0489671 [Helianthus annuus]